MSKLLIMMIIFCSSAFAIDPIDGHLSLKSETDKSISIKITFKAAKIFFDNLNKNEANSILRMEEKSEDEKFWITKTILRGEHIQCIEVSKKIKNPPSSSTQKTIASSMWREEEPDPEIFYKYECETSLASDGSGKFQLPRH